MKKQTILLPILLVFSFSLEAHGGDLPRTGPGGLAILAVKDRSSAFAEVVTQRALTATLTNLLLNMGCRLPNPYYVEGEQPPPEPTGLEKAWGYITDRDRGWSLWGQYGHNWGSQGGGRGSAGYAFKPDSYSFGTDTSLRGVTLGFAFNGYSGTQEFDSGETAHNRLDGWMLGGYSLFVPQIPGIGERLFFTLAAWGGQTDADGRVGEAGRMGKRTSSFTVDTFGAQLEAHTPFVAETRNTFYLFVPHAGVRYEGFHVSGTNEHFAGGGLSRRLGSAHWNNWELPVGMRLAVLSESLFVLPSVDVSYVRSFGETAPGQRLSDGLGGLEYGKSPRNERDALRAALNLTGGLPVPLGEDILMIYELSYTFEARNGYRDNGFKIQAGFYF